MLNAFWQDGGSFWTELPAWTSSEDASPNAFWQDGGSFWTELPAWTSSEDASPGASSLLAAIPAPVVRVDASVAATNAEALEVSSKLQFFYFEFTSLSVFDFLPIYGAALDPKIIADSFIDADNLSMDSSVNDGVPVSHCLVLPDVFGLSAAQNELCDIPITSLFSPDAFATVIGINDFVQRTHFTHAQDTMGAALVLLPTATSVDVSSQPGTLALALAKDLEPFVAFSSKGLPTVVRATINLTNFLTSRTEWFEQPAALSSTTTMPVPNYIGRIAFEGVVLDTPPTTSLILSTPVSLVPYLKDLV